MKMGAILMIIGVGLAAVGAIILFAGIGKEKPSNEIVIRDNNSAENNQNSTENKDSEINLESENEISVEIIQKEEEESTKSNSSDFEKQTDNTSQNSGILSNKEPEKSAKEKGNDFEDFMAEIFVGSGIRMKEWNKGSATSSGAIADNALNPDFFLELTTDKKPIEFWVECKYRSDLSKGITLPDYQIKRYRAKQRESRRKIFLAIATDGAPSAPESLYIVPLDSFKNEGMNREDLKSFYMSEPQKNFRGRIYNYFMNKVFKK